MSEDDTRLDRRSVLKGIGTAAAVGVGLGAATGNAAAMIAAKRRLADAYSDEGRLRAAFEEHGAGLRETLVEAGFVAPGFEFDSLDFEIDADVTGLEPTADDRLAGVRATHQDGTTTAFGAVSTSSDTHEVALFVQPERGKAYALVEPAGGGDRVLADADGVEPQACLVTRCGSCCSTDFAESNTYTCDRNCENCSLFDTDCGCSDDFCP